LKNFSTSSRDSLPAAMSRKRRDDLLVGGVQASAIESEKDFRCRSRDAFVPVNECVGLTQMVGVSRGTNDEIGTLVVLAVLSSSQGRL